MTAKKRPAMADQLDEDQAETEVTTLSQEATGLVATGVVQRRTRRVVGDAGTEVVSYTLGPRHVVIDDWEPTSYFQIGEELSVPVTTSVWQGQVTLRILREEAF